MSETIKATLLWGLKKVLTLVAALALLLWGLALLSFNTSDTSPNNVALQEPQNLLGGAGALIADTSLQMIGIGVAALFIFLARQIITFWQLGMFATTRKQLFAVFLALLGLSFSHALWPLGVSAEAPQAGGILGQVLLSPAQMALALLPASFAPYMQPLAYSVGLLIFLISVMLGLYSAGWLAQSISRLKQIIGLIWHGCYRMIIFLIRREGAHAKTKSKRKISSPRKKPVSEGSQAEEQDQEVENSSSKPSSPKSRGRSGAGKFKLPPLSLLQPHKNAQASEPDPKSLEENATRLEEVLNEFGIVGDIKDVRTGPVVTLYELEPGPGIRSSRVVGLAEDIARSMGAISCRVAPVPGANIIGIELPNEARQTVSLHELLNSTAYKKSEFHLALALGKDIGGAPVLTDLARMPHLLVAGTTGSGKSVGVNSMILSLLYRLTPEECRLILVDPKMLELSIYDGIPHLLAPVVTDPKKAVVALKWAVQEMENRYRKMAKMNVRNIDGYNERMAEAIAKDRPLSRQVQTGFHPETGEAIYEMEEIVPEKLPYIVVIIDEMADLMMVAGKDIEAAVQRLAQMARAAGIHVITATQRPSVDVITGTIKANFPSRISFKVTSKIDSRTILGEQGAEQLLGQGDSLFMDTASSRRVHSPFVSDAEVESVVEFLKAQAIPEYIESVTAAPPEENDDTEQSKEDAAHSLYDQAVAIVARDRRASTSYIQRRLSIGYNRAATLIEQMEDEGVISPPNASGKREVLVEDH